MMMNMMQNMGMGVNANPMMTNNRGNMFVRRAKDNKKGNKRRMPNRRRLGQEAAGGFKGGYRKGYNNNYQRDNRGFNNQGGNNDYDNNGGDKGQGQRQVKQTPHQQNQSRVRLDSDTFPSLPRREINVNVDVAAPGTLSGKKMF